MPSRATPMTLTPRVASRLPARLCTSLLHQVATPRRRRRAGVPFQALIVQRLDALAAPACGPSSALGERAERPRSHGAAFEHAWRERAAATVMTRLQGMTGTVRYASNRFGAQNFSLPANKSGTSAVRPSASTKIDAVFTQLTSHITAVSTPYEI